MVVVVLKKKKKEKMKMMKMMKKRTRRRRKKEMMRMKRIQFKCLFVRDGRKRRIVIPTSHPYPVQDPFLDIFFQWC